MTQTVEVVASGFAVAGTLAAVEPFGAGHINDTYRLTYRHAAGESRYLLQRINARVFSDPQALMQNMQRVTEHLATRQTAAQVPDLSRRVLTLIPARDGLPYRWDDAGSCWRLFAFVEHSHALEQVRTPQQAEQAGRAFGEFQRQLADLPGPRLNDTIPDFHNTPLRYAALARAISEDRCGRVAIARSEVDAALRWRALASRLVDQQHAGVLPERIVHNDAKMSNVLLDDTTDEALCVVDLDIVMPGLALYDFGDMVRSMTTTAAEDEVDLSTVEVHLPLFDGLARGFLVATYGLLSHNEREQLAFAGQLITLEQGVRFLTDFLNGDRYYKISRPAQNLNRCRAQFKLAESLAKHESELRAVVDRIWNDELA